MSRQFLYRIAPFLLLLPSASLNSQVGASGSRGERREIPPQEVRLPSGKLQQDEILKADHEKSLQDARQLVELSQAVQKDLEQSGANVLSIATIHKTEEIEKLAKRIRSRIRRY